MLHFYHSVHLEEVSRCLTSYFLGWEMDAKEKDGGYELYTECPMDILVRTPQQTLTLL